MLKESSGGRAIIYHLLVAKIKELIGLARKSYRALEKLLVVLKNFRHSVLNTASSGRLTSNWRNHIGILILALHSVLFDTQLFVSELAISNSSHFVTQFSSIKIEFFKVYDGG
ncbi:MAG: hypothetical protein ACHQXG_02295 [Nitrososphaerales archaeon]